MRVKSICLVCRGKQQVIDRITNELRPCAGCKGSGYIPVNFIPDKEVEVHRPKPENTTRIRILNAIKEYQNKFFDTRDMKDIRPMRLKDIAKILDIHPVTVCVKIRDQYIHDIDVRILFGANINGRSNKAVMQKMKEILDENQVSDQKMMELLHREGITISRRTVTKYRAKLGIPAKP